VRAAADILQVVGDDLRLRQQAGEAVVEQVLDRKCVQPRI
jgi:hypothetical protein